MVDPAVVSADRTVSFGPFRLFIGRRLLLEGETAVRVGSRALEILIALLERPGTLVSKEELLARVWPSTHVAEGNLKFQVAALRRALGDGRDDRRFVENSPGQGYRFVGELVVTDDAGSLRQAVPVSGHRHNLPRRMTQLIGRTELVASLANQLSSCRLLTIVGPGGMGKTSVAVAVGERLIGAYSDGVCFTDLSLLADPSLVLGAVAAAIGIEVNSGGSLESLTRALRDKRMLVVLDNCAHVVDAAAALTDAILRGAPEVRILATSREPLRVEGEHLHRLGPLECPLASSLLTAAEALRFSAVELFVEQAVASSGTFELRDEEAAVVGEICRKLDGIPLAIELAAARVEVLGVRGLAGRLDDRLQILTQGRRTALARHRTLRAALDWSYELLTVSEQMVFTRLAVFVGGFTLAAAAAVAGDASLSSHEVVDLVLDLASKSLITADVDAAEPRFRLLDTTRAYAIEKLAERGDTESAARRHAEYYRDLFATAANGTADADAISAAGAPEIDNLRAALTWAFGPGGDLSLGVSLAADSVPLWVSLSRFAESQIWKERAVHSLDGAGLRGSRQEMVLQAALGMALQIATGTVEEAHAALERALEIAEQVGDREYQLRILDALWIYHVRVGEVRTTLALARRAEGIIGFINDPEAAPTADRMLGISLHCAGEHAAARVRLKRLLQNPPASSRLSYIRRFGFDQHVIARYVLAELLWVQGFSDQALRAGREAIAEARSLEHPLTLCAALWAGSALALRVGDVGAAQTFSEELLNYSERLSLADYHTYGSAVQHILSLRNRASTIDVELIRASLRCRSGPQWCVYLTLGDFAEAMAHAGYVEEITEIVDKCLERAERNQELWAFPETLRVKGQLLLSQQHPDMGLAKEYFTRSLDLARTHGALAWELSTATSLARLLQREQLIGEARALLGAVYARFTEGFETDDLKRAKRLLDELSSLEDRVPHSRRPAAAALRSA